MLFAIHWGPGACGALATRSASAAGCASCSTAAALHLRLPVSVQCCQADARRLHRAQVSAGYGEAALCVHCKMLSRLLEDQAWRVAGAARWQVPTVRLQERRHLPEPASTGDM